MSKMTFRIKSTPQLKKSHLKKVARWLRVVKSRTELFTCLKKYAKMEGASWRFTTRSPLTRGEMSLKFRLLRSKGS